MLHLSLDMYQTLAMAVGVLYLGGFLKHKIHLLEHFCIPAPVVGGVVFAVLSLILYILPAVGRIRDFHPLKHAPAGRTYKKCRCESGILSSLFLQPPRSTRLPGKSSPPRIGGMPGTGFPASASAGTRCGPAGRACPPGSTPARTAHHHSIPQI